MFQRIMNDTHIDLVGESISTLILSHQTILRSKIIMYNTKKNSFNGKR